MAYIESYRVIGSCFSILALMIKYFLNSKTCFIILRMVLRLTVVHFSLYYTVSQKHPPFYFSNNFVKN